jgi:hypothetical protein
VTLDATATTVPELSRSENIPADYSWQKHAFRTLLLALGIAAFGVYLARTAAAADWLFLPAFFVAANAIEWTFHRGPMHHPGTPRIFYKNHTLIHHRSFHHDHMEVDDLRELGLIMMPWYTMLLLFVLASPIAIVAGLIRGPGVAGIFFLTAAAYFLMYESLHALYHMPDSVLGRLGLGGRAFRFMQAHHTHHHRLERMTFVNFNVTVPLMDFLMRTRESPDTRTPDAGPLGR